MADEAPPKDLNISLTELHSAVSALSEKLDKIGSGGGGPLPCYVTLCHACAQPCAAPCHPPCIVNFCAACYHTGPQPLCQPCYHTGPQPFCQPCYHGTQLCTPCTPCTPCAAQCVTAQCVTTQCARCVCCTPCTPACAQCQ
jgi:hypothetical protein